MSTKTIDIGQLLDDGPFSGIQKLAVVLASLAAVMDGFDGRLIGFAVPAILREWGMTREAFAPIVAVGLLGMAIGSVSVGAVADRVGRRVALIASISVFGAATFAMGFSNSLQELGALRFIAGLGIGGGVAHGVHHRGGIHAGENAYPSGDSDRGLLSGWRDCRGNSICHGAAKFRLAQSILPWWVVATCLHHTISTFST